MVFSSIRRFCDQTKCPQYQICSDSACIEQRRGYVRLLKRCRRIVLLSCCGRRIIYFIIYGKPFVVP